MSEIKDTYKTITKPSPESLFKEKGSKFMGYAFPVTNEDEIKEHIEEIKKLHHNARHWCYAWQLGENYDRYRANDDGEPANTAGMPIYGQIQAFDLTNILVISVRYFGGVKLGVGGLIQAYRASAQATLEQCKIVERTIDIDFVLKFDYPEMNTVMRIIKEEDLTVTNQDLALDCKVYISVRQKDADRIFDIFNKTYKVEIKRLE